ncbi:MAG TPA: substrate-binding domain-containing protein [Gammaproteobacteria bacterium]|jgi:molybdate transport system substrate-binding protein
MAAPLRVISSMVTRDVLRELAARYETSTAKTVVTEAAGGIDVAKRVERGDALEVVVLAANVIDRLIGQGKILAGSRVDLVKSEIAVAVRAGARKPDIATEEALRRVVQNAKTVAYSTGPSGVHLENTFARWGILEQIRPRIVVAPPGVPVGSLVADGTAELGFQQLAELMGLPGIEVIGPVPPSIQTVTVFSGAIAANCRRPDEARALLAFLASPAAADAKRRHGLEPA